MRGESEMVPRWVIGVLVGAVVVHLPDLFVAAADLDVVDLGSAMPGVPPPRRKMISSAKRWAIWRAESSLASSLYCLASTCGYCRFLASKRKPLAISCRRWTPKLPKATMAAEAGAADHCWTIDLGGRSGSRLRQQALGDDVEDAGVGEVGVEGRVEGALEAVGLRVGGGGLEVGDGDANVGDAAGGLGLEPVLCVQRLRREARRAKRTLQGESS